MSREDPDVADEMQRILSDEGIQFLVTAEPLNVHGFDEVLAENVDKAAVGLANNVGSYGGTRCQQRSACGVEHGVVGAVACAVDIAQIEQGSRG